MCSLEDIFFTNNSHNMDVGKTILLNKLLTISHLRSCQIYPAETPGGYVIYGPKDEQFFSGDT